MATPKMVLESDSSRRISKRSGFDGVMGGESSFARPWPITHVSASFYNAATEAPIREDSQGFPQATCRLTKIHSCAARKAVCRHASVRKRPLCSYLHSRGDHRSPTRHTNFRNDVAVASNVTE